MVTGVQLPSFQKKKLSTAETKYCIFDRELLAMYLAIKHFRHFVEGQEFHILADHKPLTFALSTKSTKLTPRQCRHLDYISQFTFDIHYTKGSNNPLADALSRMDTNALHTNANIDLKAMAAAQQTDTSLQNDCSSLKLKAMPLPTSDVHILCDTSTGVPRPYVPCTKAVLPCCV